MGSKNIQNKNPTANAYVAETLIINQMEYCCTLASPTDKRSIAILERVQRKFASKFAVFQTYDLSLKMPICTDSYEDQLKRLKIYNVGGSVVA